MASCSSQSPKNRFLLAEKLWHEGNYAAAVTEYERVVEKDRTTDLAMQAAYRAAMTQTLFLNEHLRAIRNLTRVGDLRKNTPLGLDAERQIGEILFEKLEQYEQAITHYSKMLETNPQDPEAPLYLFRVAKAQYHLIRFDESIETYEQVVARFPKSEWAEKAAYERGVSAQTRGSQKTGSAAADAFKDAVAKFQDFVKTHPTSALVPQARFEMASCYEELNQLTAAYEIYESLKETYPSRPLLELKLKRVRDRIAQKTL